MIKGRGVKSPLFIFSQEYEKTGLRRFIRYRRGEIHIAQGAQPVGFAVRAEHAGEGIKHTVTKANQTTRRSGLLRNNQFQCIDHRGNSPWRERGAQTLDQSGHVVYYLM